LEKIQTYCKAIDILTDGGLPTGTITQIFGEKALGKSIISLQAAFSCAAGGNTAIIIDTEQSYFSYLVPYWQARFAKKFSKEIPVLQAKLEKTPKPSGKRKPVSRSQIITALSATLTQLGVSFMETHLGSIADILSPDYQVSVESDGPSVIVLQMPEITDLLNLHGIDAGKEVSSGGRVELRLKRTPVYQSTLYNLIGRSKAKLLIYDSISAPMKSAFPSTQDLPARSAGLAMLLSHAQRMCIEFGIATVVTSHVSINPINPWNRRPYGGVILGHEAKFSLELTKEKAKRDKSAVAVNPEDLLQSETEEADEEEDAEQREVNPEGPAGMRRRMIWVARHPAMGEYSRYGHVRIDDEGVH
jgi:RecA/RadA recombinase